MENNNEQVNVVGGFQGQNGFQRKYDHFSDTYNPGWRVHPNFSYGWNQQVVGPNTKYQPSSGILPTKATTTLSTSTDFGANIG